MGGQGINTFYYSNIINVIYSSCRSIYSWCTPYNKNNCNSITAKDIWNKRIQKGKRDLELNRSAPNQC
jgi:hypothetical protein